MLKINLKWKNCHVIVFLLAETDDMMRTFLILFTGAL